MKVKGKELKGREWFYDRATETEQLFDTAFTHFENYFLKKTGVEWDQRLININMMDVHDEEPAKVACRWPGQGINSTGLGH